VTKVPNVTVRPLDAIYMEIVLLTELRHKDKEFQTSRSEPTGCNVLDCNVKDNNKEEFVVKNKDKDNEEFAVKNKDEDIQKYMFKLHSTYCLNNRLTQEQNFVNQ